MVLFVVLGSLLSFADPPKNMMKAIHASYEIVFASALASVGLNAEAKSVLKRSWAPILALAVTFGISAAVALGLAKLLS